MPSLDALCLRLTGQTLEVVQHQLMAIRANVWSWLLVTLKIRKPRLQLADCDSKTRCIVVLSPGGPERLEFWALDDGLATVGYNVSEAIAPRDPRSRSLTRVATPPPPGLVVVRITHFSVNYADVTIRWGLYESAIKFVGYPIVPGFDFSGVVEAVGDGVQDLRVGDAVFGITFFGAYSSRLLVPASQCRKTPKALTAEAAALPSVAGTALHAMALAQFWPSAPPTRNRAVLVHSAAGGVGSMLVQMAKTLGCGPVVGVVGAPHKIEACEACGAAWSDYGGPNGNCRYAPSPPPPPPHLDCGSLSSGTYGNWITSSSSGSPLQDNMGSFAIAQAACESLCSAQSAPGVCLFKNGWGGECWFSPGGTMQSYLTRYGSSDTRHYAAVCGAWSPPPPP